MGADIQQQKISVKVAAKVSRIFFARVSVLVLPILSAESIDIDIGNNICEYH